MPSMRTYSCDVVIGEALGHADRVHVPVAVATQTSLYSGRLFRINAAGFAVVGGTGGSVLYIAHRGVDASDVAGAAAVASNTTGSVLTQTAGYGMISGIPLRPGIGILTTEYTGTLTRGAVIECATASGEWRALNAGTAIAKVLEAARSINGRNQIKLLIVSAGAAKTV